MSQEIERKFLLKELPDLTGKPFLHIEQGYLCLGDKEEVRLRSISLKNCDPSYVLTVKKGSGLIRGEGEISISKQQFDTLWPMTVGRRLVKKRYDYWTINEDIEIDIYEDSLQGLLVAEVEFENEEEARAYQPPSWIGEDVTNDDHYKNRSLAVHQCIPPPKTSNWSVTVDMSDNEKWRSSVN